MIAIWGVTVPESGQPAGKGLHLGKTTLQVGEQYEMKEIIGDLTSAV